MTDLNDLITNAQNNPDDWEARLQLSEAYKELGKVNEALTALRGSPLVPMTLRQSRMVKNLRAELDPEGKTDLSGPVHPVSGEWTMEDAENAQSESVVVVERCGERSIVLAADVDPDVIKPHEKSSGAAQKASALTVAVVVHVVVALLLGFIVIALPKEYGCIYPFKFAEIPDDIICELPAPKRTKSIQSFASNAITRPTIAISSMVSSTIAIPEFNDLRIMDVTLGMSYPTALGITGAFASSKDTQSEVNFIGIRSSGSRMVFIIEASRYMLTDKKGGIPAYNKVKGEIAEMLAGMNRRTAFNLILFDGRKIATFQDELVAATPSNVRQAIEWFDPINKDFESVGLREGYTSQPIQSGIEPIPVNDLVHYIKATQRALEMDVDTIFLLSNGWGWHRKTMEPREYEKWMHDRKWGEKEEKQWAENVSKARDWLKEENEARFEKGIPRRVVTSLNEIVSEISPGVRHKPGPSYSMEEVQDQMKNAVSQYYRAKGKPRPRFNVVWFVGEDENPKAVVEAHLQHQTRRNRGKLKILEGFTGLKNVTEG